MSAFVVDDAHIDALITAGLAWTEWGPMSWYWDNPSRRGQLDYTNADEVGAMLLAENVRSVNYRYKEEEPAADYTFHKLPGRADPVVVLKAIGCYEYQACEHPDWERSEAFAFCQSLRLEAIHKLSGYEAAPWEINKRNVFLAELVS